MPQGVCVPEAKPEIQVASCGAAVLFKQRCWRTEPGNLQLWEAWLGSYLTKKRLDAWSSQKALGAGKCAKNHGPHSNCTGWDAAVEGSKGEGLFLSSQDVYSL